MLSKKVQGENSASYDLFANLCGSVENPTCPLNSSPILAVNKDLDQRDCIEIGERLSGEVYLNNATNGLSGGFQWPFGQVRCCFCSTDSQAREINLTLVFLCNSNSPNLELSDSSLDVLSVIGDCNEINNLTIILLTAKLCPQNIISLTSGLPTWIIVVVIVVIGAILIIAVIIVSIWCNKRCRQLKPKKELMERKGSQEAEKLLDDRSESEEKTEAGRLIGLPASRGQLHSEPDQTLIASDEAIQEVEEFEKDYGGIRSDSTFLNTISLPTTTS